MKKIFFIIALFILSGCFPKNEVVEDLYEFKAMSTVEALEPLQAITLIYKIQDDQGEALKKF